MPSAASGRPYQGFPELFTASGGVLGGTAAGGVGGGDVGGRVSVGGVSDTCVGWKRRSPFTGYAHSGGGTCQRCAARCQQH
jgi:hypothetical protein